MLIDPGIEREGRRFLQNLSRKLVTTFSSYQSVISSKDHDNDAFPLHTDARIYDLGPWMQDFSSIGIRTRFDDCKPPWVESLVNLIRVTLGKGSVDTLGSLMNQYARDQVVLPLLDKIFLELLKDRTGLRFVDTFSAEGFYTYYAAMKFKNVALATGVELDSRQVKRANTINEIFQITDKVEFQRGNVFDIDRHERYSVSLCMGGLYHTDDPRGFIELLSTVTTNAMIVHTVIVWDEEKNEDFIIVPAPGRQHGSRFSYRFIRNSITDSGWRIVEEGSQVFPATFNHYWNSKAAWFLCLR